MPMIVIDPGHGGLQDVGRSSSLGVRGPGGTLEKDVVLRLAQKLLHALPRNIDARLTRDRDENLSLSRRAGVARDIGADVFLSLHANGGGPGKRGAEAFVHSRARPAAMDLATRLTHALGGGQVGQAELAVLDPQRLPTAAACLLEVDYLSEPSGEAFLRDDGALDGLARRLASALADYVGTLRESPRAAPSAWGTTYGAPVPRPACTAVGGYAYAGAIKSINGLTGACATITTKPMSIPCEGTADFDAHTAIWVGVNKSDLSKWAQTGYLKKRLGGSRTVNYARYTEVKAGPNAADYRLQFLPPVDAGTHAYLERVDGTTGKWEFLYDGTVFDNWTHNGWVRETANTLTYTGELYDTNSQMAGTRADHCVFTRCQYRTTGAFTDAGLVEANMNRTNATNWGATRVSGTSIEVWDNRH